MIATPPSEPSGHEAPPRDRAFERQIHHDYTRLIEAFTSQGFKKGEARLWVGAWRHTDNPADLARAAVAFHHLQVPAGQAIPWFWERIPPPMARHYLAYRWRAAEARRVMQALRDQDPALSRREALLVGLGWAQSSRPADEALLLIRSGYTLHHANEIGDLLAQETMEHGLGLPGGPSTLEEWIDTDIPPERVLRYLQAGVTRVHEARDLEDRYIWEQDGGPDDGPLEDRLILLAALRHVPRA